MKKVLVIQTAFIGDAILASSLLESIYSSDEKVEIHLLVRKGNESLYKGHPFLKEVWVWDKSKKYKSLFSILKQLRNQNFREVFNLQRFFTSGLITVLSGAQEKYGFSKNPLSFMFTQSFLHTIGSLGDESYKHEVERNYSIVSNKYQKFIEQPKLYPSDKDVQSVAELKQKPYLTMSPSSVWFTKQWPKEKWVEFMNKNSDKQIFLLGGPNDKIYLDEIKESSTSNSEVLAGKLSLLESAALMKDADMNYVNDSAPMHLASAMNAPVTVIYCSTIPEFGFGPLSDQSFIWQTKENLECRPCGLHGF